MSRKFGGRLKSAALIVTTAMSIGMASLAAWKLGPDISCNPGQDSNAFVRMSVGGTLTRQVRKNREAIMRQMPFSGDGVLSITVKVRSNGEAVIESAKAREEGSPAEHDVTSKLRGIISIRKMNKFSDSDFTRRETFEIPLQSG